LALTVGQLDADRAVNGKKQLDLMGLPLGKVLGTCGPY
jgi:hypothetical protein